MREMEASCSLGTFIGLDKAINLMKEVYNLSEYMYREVYCYLQIEASINSLNMRVKQVGSSTYVYRTFAFSGLVLFEYSSYSLALYYFDRAFKTFYDR